MWGGEHPLWTVGTWPVADWVVVSGNGWRLAALGTVTATQDELHCAGAQYDRTLDPAALADLPGGAHVVWSDTAIDLGDMVLVDAGESPIFYTEHREGWYAASAAAPLARMVGGGVDHFEGVRCTSSGHALVLTAIGVAETRIAATGSPKVNER
ncbi:MAG TPA: hypothetical protein VJT72_18825 [Pseudonocardiaceae bacterium]|nr:hypothetical protein [Pseudonocardiaceae bacterium]